jgi:hypothetical protein
MDTDDRQVLHEILARGEGFGHRQHVELTWRYVEMRGPAGAADAVAAAIRELAAANGQPAKYHETMTRSWARCVAVHAERWPAPTAPEFIDRNPELLDPALLSHFYSSALLGSDAARARWVAPDLRDLPVLAS